VYGPESAFAEPRPVIPTPYVSKPANALFEILTFDT
jgi:hypothetical protein